MRTKKKKEVKTYTVNLTAYVEVETTIEVMATSEEEASTYAKGYVEDNLSIDIGNKCGDITHSVDCIEIHDTEVEE